MSPDHILKLVGWPQARLATHNTALTIHGHLVNLCTVVLLNITQDPNVVTLDEIDGHTPPAISPRPTNSGAQRKHSKTGYVGGPGYINSGL